MYQTEVQRVERELAQGNVTGDALLRKFRSASRGDVKLACALRGFFTEGDERYYPYLKSRIRPTVKELVLAGRIGDLESLDERLNFSSAFIDTFLEEAISSQVPDSILWLLKLKERRWGFTGQELTL